MAEIYILLVSQCTHTISLSQMAIIDKIVEQFGQKDAYPVSALLEPSSKLYCLDYWSLSSEDWLQLNKLLYWSLVGCLLYLAICTYPDISYTVQQLSQYLDCYSFIYWEAAIRLVCYLKEMWDLKLYLGSDCPFTLHAFSDSDWANCLDTCSSMGGHMCSLR